MTTKKLLSIAIIAALPFGANANDPVVAVGPAHASSNAVVATASAPYVTVTPSAADESHIATTAYVKGAYNDAIAAVNKVDSTKQNQLVTYDDNIISDNVYGYYDFLYSLTNEAPSDLDSNLVTSGAVLAGIKSQRATIYTTWDDDSATTDVAFKTVYEEDED